MVQGNCRRVGRCHVRRPADHAEQRRRDPPARVRGLQDRAGRDGRRHARPRSRSATATSTRRRCTATSGRWARPSGSPASTVTRSSSRRSWTTTRTRPPTCSPRSTPRSRELDLEWLDLFLVHWPMPGVGDFVDTWRAMEEIAASGRARAIGVSNFQPHHLQRIIDAELTVPAVNQVECHPYFTNDEVRRFGAQHGIVTEAWSPIARGEVLDDPTIVRSPIRVGRTPAQVTLRWHIQRGDVVFPKSVDAAPHRGELRAVRLRAHRRRRGRHHGAEPRRSPRLRPRRVQRLSVQRLTGSTDSSQSKARAWNSVRAPASQ